MTENQSEKFETRHSSQTDSMDDFPMSFTRFFIGDTLTLNRLRGLGD
jgi:hypothetical protein